MAARSTHGSRPYTVSGREAVSEAPGGQSASDTDSCAVMHFRGLGPSTCPSTTRGSAAIPQNDIHAQLTIRRANFQLLELPKLAGIRGLCTNQAGTDRFPAAGNHFAQTQGRHRNRGPQVRYAPGRVIGVIVQVTRGESVTFCKRVPAFGCGAFASGVGGVISRRRKRPHQANHQGQRRAPQSAASSSSRPHVRVASHHLASPGAPSGSPLASETF